MPSRRAQAARPPPAPPPRRPRALTWMAVGCGGLLSLVVTVGIIALVIVRPYQRASDRLTRVLAELAPPGTRIEHARISFPARVTIARLDLPADEARGLPAFTLQDIAGHTELRTWVSRRPRFLLSTRVWGGTLALDAAPSTPLTDTAGRLPRWQVEARARDLRLEHCVAWLKLDGQWRGRVEVDAAGEVHPQDPGASTVHMTLGGQELYIPPIDVSNVVLPANMRATLRGEARYRDELLEVTHFTLRGTGYALEATVRITLREPLESSPLRGRVALQLKEAATWRRTEVHPEVAGAMMELLIQSRGTLHAEIGGTVGEPEAILDQSTLIRSLMEQRP